MVSMTDNFITLGVLSLFGYGTEEEVVSKFDSWSRGTFSPKQSLSSVERLLPVWVLRVHGNDFDTKILF